MPHSAEAEQAVIGAMLIDPSSVPTVVGRLHADDFYVDLNREIYETIYAMFSYSQAIDPVTVLDQMKSRGVFREGRSNEYVLELMKVTPTSANVLEYAAIVWDKALMRRLLTVCAEINEMVFEGASQAELMLEAAERKIYALRKGRNVGGLVPLSSVIAGVYEHMSELSERDEPIPGLKTGLLDLDSAILGLNKSDLILIASRPGMGKTSMALGMALEVAKTSGKTVAVFSLEMAREQLAMRLLSSQSLIDGKKLMTGRLNKNEWRRLSQAAAVLSETDLRIDDNPSISVADINAECRRVKDLGLIVVDYLQLMQSAGSGRSYASENRQQAVSDMSRMLKITAKELNVPVVCLSQLSRANESRSEKRPMLSDLRESGAIEQDADIVIGLYRDGYYNRESETPNLAEAIVLKNRHGETGSIELLWMPEYTTYVNAEKRHEDSDAF